jgi:rod shape-determining protein MreC
LAHRESSGSSHWFGEGGVRTARLMIYILLAVVLMFMDQRGHYVPRARSALEQAFEPVFFLVSWPSQALQALDERTRAREELIAENESLRRHIFEMSGSMQTLDALQRENQRLRTLLDATGGKSYAFRFAEMIRVDLDPFAHKVWIDRGRDDGVVVGQAVIDGQGVVGQVEDVHAHLSSVRLISDPDHALPVQVNRTGLRTVAYGSGQTSHLVLPNLPLQADVSGGDMVVTSGLGDRFPPGFPVGEIQRVERDRGGTFAVAYLRPFAALDRGREVLLVEGPEAIPAQPEAQP